MSSDTPATIGRYQVLRALGQGGMGSVYLARDPAIKRNVAVKVMRTGLEDASLRDRFVREATAIGSLRHPNIVTVFDVGEHAGEPFIAMEYIEGATLAQRIRHLDADMLTRIDWMDGVCAGLQHAHRAGIIHRDIKPANIIIDNDGGVKIVDFGIARGPTSGVTHAATQTGSILGTLNYMSPEQLAGRGVDKRSDIYSTGVVCYELFSGRMAFPGDIQSGILNMILVTGPEPLAQIGPGLDADLVAIINRCLDREADRRFPDLGDARRELGAVRRRLEAGGAPAPTVVVPQRESERGAGRPDSGGVGPAHQSGAPEDRIGVHLARARDALARGDHTGALGACQQALVIDPASVDALALQDEIRSAQQTHDWIKEARGALDRGALTSAALLADRVLGMSPASAEAMAIRRGVEEARRRLDDLERRARAIDALLEEGRTYLAGGQLAEASQAADSAAKLDPSNQAAAQLRQQVAARLAAAPVPTAVRPQPAAEPPTSGAPRRSRGLVVGGTLVVAVAGLFLWWRTTINITSSTGPNTSATSPPLPRGGTAPPSGPTTPVPAPTTRTAADAGPPPSPRPASSPLPPSSADTAKSPSPTPTTGTSRLRADQLATASLGQVTTDCTAGSAVACHQLGLRYEHGQGVAKDDIRALTFLQSACDKRDNDACGDLGMLFRTGRGVKRDDGRAMTLFQTSCDGGSPDGCNHLGAMYRDGHGVSLDNARAVSLFERACTDRAAATSASCSTRAAAWRRTQPRRQRSISAPVTAGPAWPAPTSGISSIRVAAS